MTGERLMSVEQRAALALARELPLETKIGQLLMPGFVGTEPDPGLIDRVSRGRVGGLFLLGRNVRAEDQVQRLTGRLNDAATASTGGLTPFLATDFEGGIVNALRAVTGNTPSAAQLAARGVAGVEAQAQADAEALRWLGFNTNLAPVADVLWLPPAPQVTAVGVVGSRAFSSDARTASALSRAYARGLKLGGVIGVMKHFPGHGATTEDSHVMLPVVERSAAELHAIDLLPYRDAISAGELEAVMIGHLHVPALDHSTPTTLSRFVITGLLRDGMGFGGLVMTDELKMRAISAYWGVEEAALLALQAGVDVLLADWTGVEQTAVFSSLVRACHAGLLAPGRLEQSVARIVTLKVAYGLVSEEIKRRYVELVTALSAPAEEMPPGEDVSPMPPMDAPADAPSEMTGDETPELPSEALPTEMPTPMPTAVSVQPTPTPVSIQPTPTRPPTMTPTSTSTPSPTATRTATATATRSS